MKIEYLSYLREIEACKSISAAAKKLYIGQTTLSAIIKSIEDELGVAIPDEQLAQFKTVGDIVNYLEENGAEA